MLFRLLILVALFLFTLAKKESIRLNLNKFEISYLFYIAVMLLTAITGTSPYISIFSNLERFNGIENQIYLFFYVYLGARLLDHSKQWNIIFATLVCMSLYINLDTVVKHGSDIATGFSSLFGSKNYLAGFDFSVFVISIFLYLTNRDKLWAKLSLSIGIFALLVALITFTRAPLLGFALAFSLWLMSFGYKSFQYKK